MKKRARTQPTPAEPPSPEPASAEQGLSEQSPHAPASPGQAPPEPPKVPHVPVPDSPVPDSPVPDPPVPDPPRPAPAELTTQSTPDSDRRALSVWRRITRWHRGLSVRTRIVATVVTLASISMLVAGASAYTLQARALDKQIDASLRVNVAEFEQLAAEGNSATGKPFTSTRDLIYATMRLSIPSRHEGMLGILDNKVELTAAKGVTLRLEDDPDFIAALAGSSKLQSSVIRTLRTPMRTYRYVVIPVGVTDPNGVSNPVGFGAVVRAFDRDAEHREFRQAFRTFTLVGVASLSMVAAVGWIVAGRLLRPIRMLSDAARHISESDLSRRVPVTGHDDVSSLTETVNEMLARLQLSFDSQRELLGDVGHELRTPITIVRGHLELMDVADPTDTAATRDIALSELARMSRLVEDLMLLATSDRPDFVHPVPTRIGPMTDDMLDTVRALAPRRWTVDSRTDTEAHVDAQRLTQAVVQLAANAVRFTRVGDVIALGTAVVGDKEPGGPTLEIWVRDEGTGVAPEVQGEIFERFRRGPKGDTEHDGAGLGLSIVAAIAQAHGGDVHLEAPVAAKPGGAKFTLRLPPFRSESRTGEPLGPALHTSPVEDPAP